MEHIFILKGLDCPNCSAKIEKEVGEVAGVQLSSMNLMKQTLTVQAEASVTNLLDIVTTIVHSHEPDVEVSEKLTATVTKAFLLKGLDCPYHGDIRSRFRLFCLPCKYLFYGDFHSLAFQNIRPSAIRFYSCCDG